MPSSILPGTLDLLILKTVSLGPQRGYGILLRIRQGAVYPGLYRLESKGLISAEWGQSENNRHARFYTLTAAGRRRLRDELVNWSQLVEGMALALNARAAAR